MTDTTTDFLGARAKRRKLGTRMARKKLRTVRTKLHQARLAKARSAKRK